MGNSFSASAKRIFNILNMHNSNAGVNDAFIAVLAMAHRHERDVGGDSPTTR